MSDLNNKNDDDIIDSLNDQEQEEEYTISKEAEVHRRVRSLVFHLVYAMEAYQYTVPIEHIIDNLNRGYETGINYDDELVVIASGVIKDREKLEAFVEPLLSNWRLDRIGLCTRLILRIGAWELKNTETDPKIIINESIELAKCFSEKDAYKFVNGVLDKALQEIRSEKK